MDPSVAEHRGGLQARVLGRVELLVGGKEIPDNAWQRRNSRYLLLLLLCTPAHRLSRDMVMESLWPNASLDTATRSLYVAIHGLRRVLEPAITSGKASRFVELSGEMVQLVPGSVEWLDVAAFEAALDAGGDRQQNLAHALSLYGGDLLEDEPYLDWPAARRERLRWRWREAVLEHAEFERLAGRPMLAVPSVERVLEGDPGDEVAYRVLMTAYAAADRREDAERVFERCVEALENELGVEPGKETLALADAIRKQPVARPVVTVSRMDNLPRPANPLVGRGRETEELLDLVCRPGVELVTVTGTGGMGKTRIALEVASLGKDEFEHGVCFVPLAHIRDASLVVPAVARALGLEDVPGKPPLEQVQERLRDLTILVVIDNIEQVLDAAADLSAILEACPGMTMLVTSRVPLRVRAEHEFPLEPLAVPSVDRPISLGRAGRYPSVELFAQRASAVRRSFSLTAENVQAIAQVCARLDGLPLAIELAAARIRDLHPHELVEGLHDRFELLSGGYRDMPARHQTMRAAISWSYDLLVPTEQDVFRRLGVFEGGFGIDAVSHVTRAGQEPKAKGSVARVLAGLEEQGLVLLRDDPDERRYSMFETIREFAREELELAREVDEVAALHAGWYVSFVTEAAEGLLGRDQGAWFERLGTEVANIRVAIAYLHGTDAGGEAELKLTAGMWRYWWKSGQMEEGYGLIQRALDHAADTDGDPYARALYAAGQLAEAFGEYDRSEAFLNRCLPIFRRSGNERGVGDALDSLGILARNRGDLDQSQHFQEESLTIQRRIGNQRGIASALNGLGAVGYYRGDTQTADRHWSEAASIVRELGDDRSTVAILGNLSALATLRGDAERALSISEETLAYARRIGDENNITYALASLGSAHYELGNVETAESAYEEVLARSRESGLVQVQAVMLFDLAKIAHRREDVLNAVRLFTESLGIFGSTQNAHGIASCLEELGGIAASRGEDRVAIRWLAVAEALREAKGVSREPVDHGEVDIQAWRETIRSRLGDTRFEAEWVAARGLDADEVMREVLGELAPR
jgi:predicted ATPase/DNA-binding SARP family transcriptional activator